LVLLLAAGCASTGVEAPPTAPPATAGLSLAVHWVRDSAEHHAALVQAYALAGERVGELAAEREAGTWAVALDADETVISNTLFQKELEVSGGRFSQERWQAWARRREATALPGARAFLERVHDLGGRIVIVTNRDEAICPDTEANFRDLGLPYDAMLCRRGESRKEPRWEQVVSGTAVPGLPPLEIVMWVGDNIQDFPDLGQDLRFEPDAAFADFGRKYVVIPNPMYGSWTSNPAN
jgi:5'-nucleotidase (lipoprotein e(P4) family)